MIYNLGGKSIKIPDNEIEKSIKLLDISRTDAIELWLDDNGYMENEEQNKLDEKASKVKISMGARANAPKKQAKPRTTKVSDEKKELFESILKNLDRCVPVERENVKILKENKLIEVKIGEKTFKIDIIEQRPPKK